MLECHTEIGNFAQNSTMRIVTDIVIQFSNGVYALIYNNNEIILKSLDDSSAITEAQKLMAELDQLY